MSNGYFSVRPTMTEIGARALVDHATELAKQKGLAVSIAVVDSAGNLLMFARMDGAPPVSCDVAVGKARTAVAIGAPSALFEDMINHGSPAMLSVPGLFPLKGGVPVSEGGIVAGAIGVSGSSADNDVLVATRSVDAFNLLGRQHVA